jgi:preprotein translocase subunit SecF
MAQSLTQEQITAVTDAVFGGQKIQAIKLYREATRASLVEAKEFVEKLEDELRLQYPGRFSVSPPASSMSAPVLLAVAVAIGIAVVLMFMRFAIP